MTTFPAVLTRLLTDPGRPLLTFYDHAGDERTELSVATYANWVAKTSSLLAEELDVERGDAVRVDLPTHWLGPVFLGAAWNLGAHLTYDDGARLVVRGPDAVAGPPGTSVLACSLHPLALPITEPLPAGVLDYGREVWSQPDAFVPWDPPVDDDEAAPGLTQGELWSAAAGESVSLPAGGRVLSVTNPASPSGLVALTETLRGSGSLVLVAHPDPARLERDAEAERVTSRYQPARS